MSHTGKAERAFIMSALAPFAGGRNFKTEVPDERDLPRLGNGRIRPYNVVTFQRPFRMASGAAVAGGEKKRPYMMPFMIFSYAGDPDTADELGGAVSEVLIDARPSDTAGRIQCVGGFSYDQADTDSRPTRFAHAAWYRVHINLGI
ncbi:hypothetical protein [Microbacterium sp. No. 7]|uniref:hypothetical protein n=1 Tax=Microbacterium sp. No. 7 TaxID=1714373 RepID=UPI0006D09299|nr:hypothetical protein [Microbacterium sp. No. 7]ALJ19584.1 hypothetical protein AOA12_06540 [Microbacterium sp. No. 7]